MKKLILTFAIIANLTACQTTGTPEQQALRGKNIAKLEAQGWTLFGSIVSGFINSQLPLPQK